MKNRNDEKWKATPCLIKHIELLIQIYYIVLSTSNK